MGDPPVNLKLAGPTGPADLVARWQQEGPGWTALNTQSQGHPGFFPLTVKASYIVGVIHDICQSVDLLLSDRRRWPVTYIPAYGVFASAVELMGRCINGNDTTSNNTADLMTGFKWLVPSPATAPDEDTILIQTGTHRYTVGMLAALRHFAAHGQATSKRDASGQYRFGSIEYEILGYMPALLSGGLERYWFDLVNHEAACNNLAKANVIALRNWPVLKTWLLLQGTQPGKHPSITDIFTQFNWKNVGPP